MTHCNLNCIFFCSACRQGRSTDSDIIQTPSTNSFWDTRCFYIGHNCEIPPKPIPENGVAILYGHDFPTNFSCRYSYNFSSAFGSSKTFHIHLEYNSKQKRKSEIDLYWYPFSVCCT